MQLLSFVLPCGTESWVGQKHNPLVSDLQHPNNPTLPPASPCCIQIYPQRLPNKRPEADRAQRFSGAIGNHVSSSTTSATRVPIAGRTPTLTQIASA